MSRPNLSLGPLALLIVQPTPFCNLHCDYCYLPNRSDTSRMSLDLLDRLAERLVEARLLPQQLTLVWHAGEPLVLPVDYYRAAFGRLRSGLPESLKLRQAFQTNATLIDDAWCDLFAEPDVGVGVSVDGPKPLHDAHRHTRSGQGTFEATMRGVRRLQAADIPFHCISVLTADALEYPDELFEYYLDAGIHRVAFNIEEQEGTNLHSSLGSGDAVAAFKRFLRRFIKRSSQAGWPLAIREIDQLLASLSQPCDATTNTQAQPLQIINMDWQGNVATHSPELLGNRHPRYPSFVIGNIANQSFAEMATGPLLRTIQAEIDEGIELCRRDCAYFDLCGGGVPANKLFEHGTFATAETLYCRLMRKAIVDVALECEDLLANHPGVAADQARLP